MTAWRKDHDSGSRVEYPEGGSTMNMAVGKRQFPIGVKAALALIIIAVIFIAVAVAKPELFRRRLVSGVRWEQYNYDSLISTVFIWQGHDWLLR